MGKYTPLTEWLRNCSYNISLSFEDIERIIFSKLPPSAYKYVRWWLNDWGHSQGRSWIDAGYIVTDFDQIFKTHSVNFQKTAITHANKNIRKRIEQNHWESIDPKGYLPKREWYDSIRVYNDLVELFLAANRNLIDSDYELFLRDVSERSVCGALMIKLNGCLLKTPFHEYYTDIEYNRNKDRSVKTIINDEIVSSITCDVIIHSRGAFIEQDNLIAIEMKKAARPRYERISDKNRLVALTKRQSDVWSYDGKTFPQHVCRYILGIYYEISSSFDEIYLEFYHHGNKVNEQIIKLKKR